MSMQRFCVATLFSLLVFLPGCAAQEMRVHTLFAECQRPRLASLPTLDAGEHIGGEGNVQKLLTIIDVQGRDIERFANALRCYERQTEKSGGQE